jgi:transposase
MKEVIIMTQYREILRLHSLGFSQVNIADSVGCARKTVRNVINRSQELDIHWPLEPDTTNSILEEQIYPKATTTQSRRYPDMEYIHKELMRNGVSKRLLWTEYCEDCRTSGELPLMYSQFCYHYQQYAEKKQATMHINRKPAEICEVDWAGQMAHYCDRDTGELLNAYIFVAALPYSMYAYVEAFPDMKMGSWITAHVNMFRFFGGITKTLVPDNLKTGVKRVDWHDPEINKTYREMSEHYNTAVIPARVRHPKDKASVEGTVGKISTWVIAALRNEQYFSIKELNKDIRKKLDAFNTRAFQKKEGSRLSIFLGEEKSLLLPLPATPFELSEWKQATVAFNYHISVDKMFYSVPYEYIKHRVEVRVTSSMIEVFYQNNRICSHPRLSGRDGMYSTIPEHMPAHHQHYQEWDSKRFLSWAEKIGLSTVITIKSIITSKRVEQQSYRSCMGLLKLADKYSVERLERACARALYYTMQPSYKSVKTILETGQDKLDISDNTQPENKDDDDGGFTRGADYYGGNNG